MSGGVVALADSRQTKAGRGVGERIDAVEVGHEVREDGWVHRRAQAADVDLGQW